MTALAGLPAYLDLVLDLVYVASLSQSIQRHVKLREGKPGWSDAQMVTALVLLNLAGGDAVEDLEILEKDAGFGQVLRKVERHGLPRQERRALEGRWRKPRQRAAPSPSAVFRYLEGFHNGEEEQDATLVETHQRDALYCYQGFKAYQPYWAEPDLVVHSEFRDGNVPAGYKQLRGLPEALELLPAGVEQVRLRSDTAG
jgi:hypothetical protein